MGIDTPLSIDTSTTVTTQLDGKDEDLKTTLISPMDYDDEAARPAPSSKIIPNSNRALTPHLSSPPNNKPNLSRYVSERV